ncbi:hypothetical protein [Confluentibacter sediminis]|uniref:hypothetical protein n=1 Tax=Confluentibacter sediminis TaxID=2219045 RepID=UPI000DAC553E|nr:hypothetical protein [Confluentibacter sediminis]
MKTALQILIPTLISTFSFAQNNYQENDTIPNYFTRDDTVYKKPDISDLKNEMQKKYGFNPFKEKKISESAMYFDKQLNFDIAQYRETGSVIRFASDIRYASNNQVFAYFDKNTKYFRDTKIYHENGKLWYQKVENEPEKGMWRTEQYDENGMLITQEQGYYGSLEETPFGEIYAGGSVLTVGSPSFFPVDEANAHFGYLHAGKILGADGSEISGFFYPLSDSYLGKASLLYFKNKDGKTGYWAIVEGNQIEQVFDDPNLPTLDIFDVLTHHSGEEYTIHKINKSVYKDKLKDYKTPKEIYADIHVLNFGTTDANYTGYGMRITTKDNILIGDERYIEVGFFKDGKLNGPGVKLFIGLNMYYREDHKQVYVKDIDIKNQMGLFANGVYVSGRQFAYTKANVEYMDVFSRPEHPNIYYRAIYNETDPFIENETVAFNSLKVGDKIFLPKSKRVFDITRLDSKERRIYFVGDKPGEEISVGKESGNIYLKYTTRESQKVSCPVTVYRKQYKKVPVNMEYSLPVSKRHEVSSLYGAKVYITHYNETKTLYLWNKTVEDGVKEETCPKCNGSGYTFYTQSQNVKQLINFEEVLDEATKTLRAKELAEKPVASFNAKLPLYTKEVSSGVYYFYQNGKRIQDPVYFLPNSILPYNNVNCYYKSDQDYYFGANFQNPEPDGKVIMTRYTGSYIYSSVSKEKQTFVFEGKTLIPQDYELIVSRSKNSLLVLKQNALVFEISDAALFPKLSETVTYDTRSSYYDTFLLFEENGGIVVIENGKVQPKTDWELESNSTENFLINRVDDRKYKINGYDITKADIINKQYLRLVE